MEGILSELYSNTSVPFPSAFILGLMTAISPCPMATNITAIGFIGKDLGERHRIFYGGLFYTVGRIFSYSALAMIIYLGADQFKVSGIFQQYGEKVLGPLLIIIGIFMLGIVKLNFPAFNKLSERIQNKKKRTYMDIFLLGVVFALAFCPYSGVLYFGMLIPLTLSSATGFYLPVIYAIATGIPVIIFAWFIAYTVSGVGRLYNRIKIFEYWFRKLVAILFIGVGVYSIFSTWL